MVKLLHRRLVFTRDIWLDGYQGVRKWSPLVDMKINLTHDAGKLGRNRVTLLPLLLKHRWVALFGSPSPTPSSPEENKMEMPRAPGILVFKRVTQNNGRNITAPSWANSSHARWAKLKGTVRLDSQSGHARSRWVHTSLFVVAIAGRYYQRKSRLIVFMKYKIEPICVGSVWKRQAWATTEDT